jgi:hypothetical protein
MKKLSAEEKKAATDKLSQGKRLSKREETAFQAATQDLLDAILLGRPDPLGRITLEHRDKE